MGAESFAALMVAAGDSAEHAHAMFDDSVTLIFGLAAAVAGIVAVVLAMVLARRLARPIERLAAAAARIADGDLSARVPEQGPVELRELAASYNTMASRLAAQEAIRREFIVNASHELRTPLTNLQGYLEALRDGVLPPDPATFDSLREEVDRLTRLAASLDVLAGAEGEPGIARDVDVAVLVRNAADLVAPSLARRSISLTVDVAPGHAVPRPPGRADPGALEPAPERGPIHPADGEVLVAAARGMDGVAQSASRTRGPGDPARGPAAGLGALLPRREVA